MLSDGSSFWTDAIPVAILVALQAGGRAFRLARDILPAGLPFSKAAKPILPKAGFRESRAAAAGGLMVLNPEHGAVANSRNGIELVKLGRARAPCREN